MVLSAIGWQQTIPFKSLLIEGVESIVIAGSTTRLRLGKVNQMQYLILTTLMLVKQRERMWVTTAKKMGLSSATEYKSLPRSNPVGSSLVKSGGIQFGLGCSLSMVIPPFHK